MTRQDKTRQDKTRQDKHCHSRQYLSIPCCVKKDDKDGNFMKVENATLIDIGIDIARTVTCHEPNFSVHHCNMIIVAMRGRNPEHPTDRTPGIPTEQRLEPNLEGISNTLTTVQKDNLVMEKVLIKQATKEGYIEREVGGLFDASFPDSNTRRGRVQDPEHVSSKITAKNQETYRYESQYRIRKLTPRECFRLMGVKDDDSQKMIDLNSNTQCYKQAGNSIVVDVMAAMFRKLF